MENLINEDENALQSERVKEIYECLSKPKYIMNKEPDTGSDSDSSDDELMINRRRRLRYF